MQTFVVRTFPITRGQLEDAVGQLQQTLVDNQDSIASGALTTAATVGEVFTGFVLALFTLFFFLKDGRSIWLWLVGLFPGDSRAYIDEAARRAWRTLISYVRATAAVALVDAIGIGIGLAILGRAAGHPARRAGVPRARSSRSSARSSPARWRCWSRSSRRGRSPR